VISASSFRKDGICFRTKSNLDYWSKSDKYKDRVLFLECSTESPNQDILEKYDIETFPTFVFIQNNTEVGTRVAGPTTGRFATEKAMDDLLKVEK
jgi:thiol-disulfide isomerase/thioredoxin